MNELKKQKLIWLPWVGANYLARPCSQRLLIVGESHYFGDDVSEDQYDALLQAHLRDDNHTRHTLFRLGIENGEIVKTYRNIPRLLFGKSTFQRERFWSDTAYHNFVQFPMRHKGRPSLAQFEEGWVVFCELLKLLRPAHCLFIGVTASHSFNNVLGRIGISHTPVQYSGKVGSTYGRTASVHLDDHASEMIFVKHLGSRMSPGAWNQHLRNVHPLLLSMLEAGRYVED